MIRLRKVIFLVAILLIGLVIPGCGKSSTVGVNTTVPNEAYVSSPSAVGDYISRGENGSLWIMLIGDSGVCFVREKSWEYTFAGEWKMEGGDQLVIHWTYAFPNDDPTTMIYRESLSSEEFRYRVYDDRLVGEGSIWFRYEG